MRRIAVFLLMFFAVSAVYAQDDGIPNNCPFTGGVFYNQNAFVRAANGRTAIVDWSSGAEIRLLSDQRGGVDVLIGKWSPECQYVAVPYGTSDENGLLIYKTVIFDAVNGGEVAVFEGARQIPYPITWDNNSSRLLVETRFGAYLRYIGGGDVWLTSEADGNSRAFRAGSVRWDYAANQVIGVLTIPPFGSAAYDMSSGALVGLTDQFNRPQDVANANIQIQGRENGEKYRCLTAGRPKFILYPDYFDRRITHVSTGTTSNSIENAQPIYQADQKRIVLVDTGNNEIIRVLVEDADYTFTYRSGFRWLDNCTKLRVSFYPLAVTFDLTNGTREVTPPSPQIPIANCRYRISYNLVNKTLAAVPFTSGYETVFLETDFEIQEFENLERSPDCRYSAVDIMQNNVTDTVIYDISTQTRVAVIPNAVGVHREVSWSPDNTYALVHTKDGGVLLNLTTGAQFPTNSGAEPFEGRFELYGYRHWREEYPSTRSFRQVGWDTARGLMFGVPVNQPNVTQAIDLNSGAVVSTYHIEGSVLPVKFIQNSDKIVIFADHQAPDLAPGKYGIAVWNISSNQGIQLATPRPVTPTESYASRSGVLISSPHFSPDGRYMLMRGRHNTLLIWDLTALPGTSPHLPSRVLTVINTRAATFVDNTTIEVILIESSTSHNQTYRAYRYDAVSGALLSENADITRWDYWKYTYIPY